MERLHATAVVIDGEAVLLTGPSGSGKSDLALRLIDRGARLLADDQVLVTAESGRLVARCPAAIAGRMEVRGIGIIALPCVAEAPVRAVFDLSAPPQRLPETAMRTLAGIPVPLFALLPFEVAAVLKVELAFKQALTRLEDAAG